MESALIRVGKRVEAQKTHLSRHCDLEHIHNSLCVTPLPWNYTEQNWDAVKNHLQGAFDKVLEYTVTSYSFQRSTRNFTNAAGTKGAERSEKLSLELG